MKGSGQQSPSSRRIEEHGRGLDALNKLRTGRDRTSNSGVAEEEK